MPARKSKVFDPSFSRCETLRSQIESYIVDFSNDSIEQRGATGLQAAREQAQELQRAHTEELDRTKHQVNMSAEPDWWRTRLPAHEEAYKQIRLLERRLKYALNRRKCFELPETLDLVLWTTRLEPLMLREMIGGRTIWALERRAGLRAEERGITFMRNGQTRHLRYDPQQWIGDTLRQSSRLPQRYKWMTGGTRPPSLEWMAFVEFVDALTLCELSCEGTLKDILKTLKDKGKTLDVTSERLLSYTVDATEEAKQLSVVDCSICLDSFASVKKGSEPDTPVKTSCGHIFGLSCLQTWNLEHSSCPICRRALFHKTDVLMATLPTNVRDIAEEYLDFFGQAQELDLEIDTFLLDSGEHDSERVYEEKVGGMLEKLSQRYVKVKGLRLRLWDSVRTFL